MLLPADQVRLDLTSCAACRRVVRHAHVRKPPPAVFYDHEDIQQLEGGVDTGRVIKYRPVGGISVMAT